MKSGPPELPGLMEQSTWIMLKGLPSTLMARFTQETMPCDIEKVSSPSGLPTAATVSPICTLPDFPITTGWKFVPSTLMTAMS